jgi:hypothetical protein
MEGIRKHLRQAWTQSKAFRIVMTIAVVYAVLRLIVHGAYLAMMLYPNSGLLGGMPGWAGAEGEPMVPVDLQIYLDAAERFTGRQPLYAESDRIEVYQYPPLYALAFVPFLGLPPVATVAIHSLLHVAAYTLLYVMWNRVFQELGFEKAQRMMAWTLPIWLVFSSFWSDLGYLNIYIIVALLATLLVAAVLEERSWRAALWLTIILQIKPHWAFAAVVPLLLGRHRFFLKLVALTAAFSVGLAGTAMLAGGPDYVIRQHIGYVRLLPRLVEDFPWRDTNSRFLGYNHSIKQVVFYLLGVSEQGRRLVTGIKALLLTPVALVGWRSLLRSRSKPPRRVPELALDLTFALYLAIFVWLDMVWEASLAVAIFAYLLGTLEHSWARVLVCVVFVPYALIDLWQLLSFATFGMDVIAPGPYILTDPSIYIPMVMIVILVFYGIILNRLWRSTPAPAEASIC